MNPRRGAAPALAALLLAAPAARAGAAASGAGILAREIGPRAAGLAGAYAARAEGVDALWWNPAGLATLKRVEAGLVQSRWLEDFGLYGLQFAAPAGPRTSFGAGVLYADYGTFELVDRSGATQFGRYSAGDLVAAGGAARSWDDGRFSLGATAKLLQQRIESESARTLALDFGGRWRREDWSAAAVLQNLGPAVKFRSEASPLPMTLRLGGAWVPYDGATLSLDLVRPRDAEVSARLGGEYRTPAVWGMRAAVRLGYGTQADAFTGLAYGVGIESENWSFDFAVRSADAGRAASWIGLSGRFGGRRDSSAAARSPADAAPSAGQSASSAPRPSAKLLADVMAWYRRKVAEGLLTAVEREEVLRRLLAEFEPQGLDVGAIRDELETLAGGKK